MISLQNIEKVYRTNTVETLALNSISLDIAKGEFLSIIIDTQHHAGGEVDMTGGVSGRGRRHRRKWATASHEVAPR